MTAPPTERNVAGGAKDSESASTTAAGKQPASSSGGGGGGGGGGKPSGEKLAPGVEKGDLTMADLDVNVVITGFCHALIRHLHAFHVVANGQGVWSTEVPPCETPEFSELERRFYLGDDGPWTCGDRVPPPTDALALVYSFVKKLYIGVDLEQPVVVYALVLIERFARCASQVRGAIRMHTLRPLVITAFVISCKMYFDEDVYVGDFTRLALGDDERSVGPLVNCERSFLYRISYVMVVRPRTFAQYFRAMKDLTEETKAAAAKQEEKRRASMAASGGADASKAASSVAAPPAKGA